MPRLNIHVNMMPVSIMTMRTDTMHRGIQCVYRHGAGQWRATLYQRYTSDASESRQMMSSDVSIMRMWYR